MAKPKRGPCEHSDWVNLDIPFPVPESQSTPTAKFTIVLDCTPEDGEEIHETECFKTIVYDANSPLDLISEDLLKHLEESLHARLERKKVVKRIQGIEGSFVDSESVVTLDLFDLASRSRNRKRLSVDFHVFPKTIVPILIGVPTQRELGVYAFETGHERRWRKWRKWTRFLRKPGPDNTIHNEVDGQPQSVLAIEFIPCQPKGKFSPEEQRNMKKKKRDDDKKYLEEYKERRRKEKEKENTKTSTGESLSEAKG
jgi:hypothetical protein